jgi:hypothetical protein
MVHLKALDCELPANPLVLAYMGLPLQIFGKVRITTKVFSGFC